MNLSMMIQVYRQVLEILEIVRREISVIKQPSFVLFPTHSHISLMVGMLQDTTATNGQKFCLLIVMRVLKEKNDRGKINFGRFV